MGDIVTGKFGKQAERPQIKRSMLCKHGHHSWQLDKTSRFDVKFGKLVTVKRCVRCGVTKNILS